jgi:fatty acid desaturase
MCGIVNSVPTRTEHAMKARSYVALATLFLLGALMLLGALALGSFSIQWIGAYALAIGALTVWGFTAAAGYTAYRGRPMRPWSVRSGVTVAASLVVVVVAWGPTAANFRTHHHSHVLPLLPTSRQPAVGDGPTIA